MPSLELREKGLRNFYVVALLTVVETFDEVTDKRYMVFILPSKTEPLLDHSGHSYH